MLSCVTPFVFGIFFLIDHHSFYFHSAKQNKGWKMVLHLVLKPHGLMDCTSEPK